MFTGGFIAIESCPDSLTWLNLLAYAARAQATYPTPMVGRDPVMARSDESRYLSVRAPHA